MAADLAHHSTSLRLLQYRRPRTACAPFRYTAFVRTRITVRPVCLTIFIPTPSHRPRSSQYRAVLRSVPPANRPSGIVIYCHAAHLPHRPTLASRCTNPSFSTFHMASPNALLPPFLRAAHSFFFLSHPEHTRTQNRVSRRPPVLPGQNEAGSVHTLVLPKLLDVLYNTMFLPSTPIDSETTTYEIHHRYPH